MTVFPEEILAAVWALSIDAVPTDARRRRTRSSPSATTSSTPTAKAVAARLLQHCRLPAPAAPAALRAFERDSQAGTGSPGTASPTVFTEANLARFERHPRPLPGAPPGGRRPAGHLFA